MMSALCSISAPTVAVRAARARPARARMCVPVAALPRIGSASRLRPTPFQHVAKKGSCALPRFSTAVRAAADEGWVEEPKPPAADGETNWGAEFGMLILRVGVAAFMVHNGLDKLADPEGFSKFVVEKFFPFLPAPLIMTYLAAVVEVAGSAALAVGLQTRLASLGLLSTMGFAVYFHIADSGLEGFPLAVVENHAYAYEAASLYFFIYFFFLCNGGGKLSLDNVLKK